MEQTVQYVLAPERMKLIASAVIAEYDREFSTSKLAKCDKAIAQLNREINKYVDALLDAPKAAYKHIYQKIEELETQKSTFESDRVKLQIASELRFTEPEIRAWLKSFCTGDAFDPDFRRNIIETFINAVYVYDNRIIIFYNIKGGKQVSYTDLTATLNKKASKPGSDLDANGGA